MPRDWLTPPKKRAPTLGELIAAKDYLKAIEVLRAQLARRPGVQTRLQLADLLLLAGRQEEAVPILIGLADELTGDGFVAKAVAILKRVDRLEPGRADIESRLTQLARQPSRPTSSSVPTPPPMARPLLFGMEEVEGNPIDVSPVSRTEPFTPEPEPEPTPIETTDGPEVVSTEVVVEPQAEAGPEPTVPVTIEEPPSIATAVEAKPVDAVRREPAGLSAIWKRLFSRSEPTAPPLVEALAIAESPSIEPVIEGSAPDAAEPLAEATPVVEAAIAIEVAPEPFVEEPSTPPGPEPRVDADDGASTEDDDSPAVRKLGGVFKRFLASLPEGTAPDGTDESDRASRDFADALAAAGLEHESDGDDDAMFQSFIDEEEMEAESRAPVAAESLPPENPPAAEVLADIRPAAPNPARASASWTPPMSEAGFHDQVLDLIEEVLKRPEPEPASSGETTEPIASAYRDELLAHPLFRDLSDDAMLAMLRALRFACFEPGEIIVSEGEPGDSLFLLISGDVKLFVRSPAGHNVPVGRLTEGSFFGEMSLLSGRPRNATVTSAGRVDLLELPKPLLDGIAQIHPRVRDTVDALYVQRASSAEVSAARNVSTGDAETRERAMQVLKAYFGGRSWEPRMQLKLAMVLLKAGKEDEAVPVLVDLADTLLREGDPAKAIGILKKVEMIRRRSFQVVNLAPLVHLDQSPLPDTAPATRPASPRPWAGRTEGFFQDWLGTFRRSVAGASAPAGRRIPGYGPGLVASPLFEDFSEEELLAFMHGLRLNVFEPGDMILTEGEPGESVFILTTGTVRVFVRSPSGHDTPLCELHEGAFFGEVSTLSGRPRTATVTAASRCELLELDRPALEAIGLTHPRVRQVLEEVYIERASSAAAARIRTEGPAEA